MPIAAFAAIGTPPVLTTDTRDPHGGEALAPSRYLGGVH